MYHFELNNNIEDVPMKFSDKFLNLLNNSNIPDSCDDDIDIDKFQLSEYKYDTELMAIEMYEMLQKKKQQTLKKIQQSKHQNVQSTNLPDNWKTLRSKVLPEESNTNSMFYNMVSGQILQPQQLNNHNSSAHPVNNVDCDNGNSSFLECQKSLVKNHSLVNPKEFENDDSSPFDNVELQTIDDKKELNKVFGALNLSREKNPNSTVPRNSPILTLNENINNVSNHVTCFANNSNQYQEYSNAIYSTAAQHSNNATYNRNSPYSNFKMNNTFDPMVYNPSVCSPYSSSNYQASMSPTHLLPKNAATINNIPFNSYYNPTNYNFNYNQNMIYSPLTNHSALEMRRSSSEKKDLFNNLTPVNSNMRSKSVSDLTKISSCDSDTKSIKSNNGPVGDRSKTPPTKPPENVHHRLSPQQHNQTKRLVQHDPYDSLAEEQKKFVDSLCQMGFKRDRISRAVKHMDINNDKKIFEFLLALQQLEDQGYDCYEGEIALHFNNYNKNEAENFLKILKQMCDFGFDKEKSIKALFKTNNDRDKAIELLLKLN